MKIWIVCSMLGTFEMESALIEEMMIGYVVA